MRTTSHILGVALVGLVACATFTNDICEYPGACPAQTMGDAAVDAPVVPGCDPRVDASCLSNARGVFVAVDGAAGGDGTQDKPLRTIAEALPLAKDMRNNIYICGETLRESVQLTSNVNLFGGFTCASWAPGTARTKVESNSIALDVSGGTVTVSDLEFVSSDQVGAISAEPGAPGKSSIAAWIHGSATVTATRSAFRAGNGGAANAPPGTTADGARNGLSGASATAAAPGSGGSNARCAVSGGKGGVGAGAQSTHGTPNPPDMSAMPGRRGCNKDLPVTTGPQACADGTGACGGGRDGAAGKGGVLTAAATSAALSDLGLVPSQGAPGAEGVNGGGAGGGGGGDQADRNGGGGGAGGCGGAGGKGGAGGGSSVAILVHNARFSADAMSEASSKDGGSGGKGQDGQPGGNGGAPGTGECNGGRGGNGGGGAAGQNGPGGLTAGIVFDVMSTISWRGTEVRADIPAPSSMLGGVTVGAPGASPLDVAAGGAGGTGGAGSAGKGDDGLTGAAGKAALALKL